MRNYRSQFLSAFLFLSAVVLLLTNGFTPRISAQNQNVDVVSEIAPIGEVIDEILRNYVRPVDAQALVEGALKGMMQSLDDHSSYITAEQYQRMTEETLGEFEGIGVSIHLDDFDNIRVHQPLPGSPAEKAGVLAGDLIHKIDGTSTEGMSLQDAAELIRGRRGTTVDLTLVRPAEVEGQEAEIVEVTIRRGKIPLESISEARMFEDGIAYIRVSDFKRRTAEEIAEHLSSLSDEGMRAFILDLRWNPGGLLTSSKEVCELFLPRNTLVTYTKSMDQTSGKLTEEMRLWTEREPVIAETIPMVILVNELTASSAEIVTGALQYWSRALVVGTKTYGKGSVQTLIRLNQPQDSALRLTTGLYYTPADVTIDEQGIKPDVEVPLETRQGIALLRQLVSTYRDDPELKNEQNHGLDAAEEPATTEQAPAEAAADEAEDGTEQDETVVDVQLERALEMLREGKVFEDLLVEYHKDTSVTQISAKQQAELDAAKAESETDSLEGGMETEQVAQ